MNTLLRNSALRTRSIDVLIVDDDGGASATLQCVLEENGCIARIARGSEDAIAEIRRRRPEVVVIDLTLSDIVNGAALADAIAAESPERGAIAVVAITTAADRSRALTRAFDACLAEPVALEVITDVVRRLGADMRAARTAAREAAG